jgi:hypothetical protein
MQIGELLVAAGLVTQAQIEQAIDRQHDAGGRLGPNLVAVGAISPEDLAQFVDGVPVEPSTVAETGLPEAFLIDLMLKFLFIGTAETTAELSAALRLPPGLVTELLEAATRGQMVAASWACGMN